MGSNLGPTLNLNVIRIDVFHCCYVRWGNIIFKVWGMPKTDTTQLALSVKVHAIKELVVSRTFERLII